MNDDPREVLLELMAEVEQKLSAARGVLTLPMNSTTVLRCVELIANLQDTLKILETEINNLEQ